MQLCGLLDASGVYVPASQIGVSLLNHQILSLLKSANRGHQDLVLDESVLKAKVLLSDRSLSKAISQQEH